MDEMAFLAPVHVGDILRAEAQVNWAGRTSMEVGVRVEAENVRTGETTHTSTAYLTMVALTDEGEPKPVAKVQAESDEERRREREAQLRRDNRLRERDEIRRGRDG